TTAETEPLSGFIGDSLALPIYQGGTMITILLFMLFQDPILGVAAIGVIPIQAILIPKIQRKVNLLGRERVRNVRKLSQDINEAASGLSYIRLNGIEHYTLSKFSDVLGDIFFIRLNIYKLKFLMKFLNNLIGQLTPLMFLSLGGYLVMNGQVSIGALVAMLAAYKDLTAPWKELLNYYQRLHDSTLKFKQIDEQFSPHNPIHKNLYALPPKKTDSVHIEINQIAINNQFGNPIIEPFSADWKPGSLIAITSTNSTALSSLADVLTGLHPPSSGDILFLKQSLKTLKPEMRTRLISYSGPEPFMFNGTIMQNLFYGLRLIPPSEDTDDEKQNRHQAIEEAILAGNSQYTSQKLWTDFDFVGATQISDFRSILYDHVRIFGHEDIIYSYGLKDIVTIEPIRENLLKARPKVQHLMRDFSHYIEPFESDHFNPLLSNYENLLFAIADPQSFNVYDMACDPCIIRLLGDQKILNNAIEIGWRYATTLQNVINHETDFSIARLRAFKFLQNDAFQKLLEQMQAEPIETALDLKQATHSMDLSDKEKLSCAIFLSLCPHLHGQDLINDRVRTNIVNIRHQIIKNDIKTKIDHVIERLDPQTYNTHLNVEDNLLFGRINTYSTQELEKIHNALSEANKKANIYDLVIAVSAVSTQVGVAGNRIPIHVKQTIQYLRAIIKLPRLLIINQAFSTFENDHVINIIKRTKNKYPQMTIIYLENKIKNFNLFADRHVGAAGGLRATPRPPAPTRVPPPGTTRPHAEGVRVP
ncbi:MAG: ABC transporter ATP-binding protein/permease, partial [Pseudomonadota bacterium]